MFFALLSLWTVTAPAARAQATNAPPANPPPAAATPAAPTMDTAFSFYSRGKLDEAIGVLNSLLEKDPTNRNALILRGTIYGDKQMWDQGEKDFQTILQTDPKNEGVQYDLADLKLKEKQFDQARAAFVPLQNNSDPDLADLIKYKIYLCDLLGGHEALAAQELDAFNKVGSHASYYFANVAWSLVHNKTDDARSWLTSAVHIYSPRKQAVYSSMLVEMGYLPLKPAADKT